MTSKRTLPDTEWFTDDEFQTPLPAELSLTVARFYGTGNVGISFAQGLAAFLDIDHNRDVMMSALTGHWPAQSDR